MYLKKTEETLVMHLKPSNHMVKISLRTFQTLQNSKNVLGKYLSANTIEYEVHSFLKVYDLLSVENFIGGIDLKQVKEMDVEEVRILIQHNRAK